MHGPNIIARSLSKPAVEDSFGNLWQYHSRSDRHSKIACWSILFDLLLTSPLIREHIIAGKIGFGINHEMTNFATNKKKNLDLVICIPSSSQEDDEPVAFADLPNKYDILLSDDERGRLTNLPTLTRKRVGDVLMATEAKAAMTKHSGAVPRFNDELTSAFQCINGSAQNAIAVGFAMVNAAPEFISSDSNKIPRVFESPSINRAKQPDATERITDTVRKLKVRGVSTEGGFDALGLLAVDMRNDGTPVRSLESHPAVATNDALHYEMMVRRIASIYNSRFAHL